jgi:hypothetical protein
VGRAPLGAQEILKGGARGAKLFYSLKTNKKTQVLLDDLLSKIRLFMFHIKYFTFFSRGEGHKLKQNLEGGGRKV